MPNLSGALAAPRYAHQDQHRFGIQGFNGNGPGLTKPGISWTIDHRQLLAMEPNSPNTSNPVGEQSGSVLGKREAYPFRQAQTDRVGQGWTGT